MELILWLLVSYYLANHLITDTAYAVRGLDPPRHKERMAKLHDGGERPAGYRSGRHGASRFFTELWHDSWDRAHDKRLKVRENRQVKRAEKKAAPRAEEALSGDDAELSAQPDGDVDSPRALRPLEDDGNVVPLHGPRRRTEAHEAVPPTSPSSTERKEPTPAPEPHHANENRTPGTATPATSGRDTQPIPQSPSGQVPLTAPLGPVRTDTEAPPTGDAVTSPPRTTTAQQSPASTTSSPLSSTPASIPVDAPEQATPVRVVPPSGIEEDPYPSLFKTPEEWDANLETLSPETRKTLAVLHDRTVAANGTPIPITVAEQAAVFQARGYPPDVAQQAAEESHAEARRRIQTVMTNGFLRLSSEKPKDSADEPHEEPAADGGAAAKKSQEGNHMSVMTNNSNGTQPDAETANLGSAIRFVEGMATSMREAASRTETSIASLQGGEVGPGPIAVLQQAMEQATTAAVAFDQAKAELEKQMSVKEAYDATPDAGSKQFLTTD